MSTQELLFLLLVFERVNALFALIFSATNLSYVEKEYGVFDCDTSESRKYDGLIGLTASNELVLSGSMGCYLVRPADR